MVNDLDLILNVGKPFHIEEALILYTSKIEVKDWVGLHHKYNQIGCKHGINPEKTRKILNEYKRAVLLIGNNLEKFREGVLAIEKALYPFSYKVFALLNEPCGLCSKKETELRPSLAMMSIDTVATIKRFKKNFNAPDKGDYLPYALVLFD